MTLAPAILGWVSKRTSWSREGLAYHLEAAALLIGLMVLGYLTFVSPWGIIEPALPVVPFLLWAALRFGSTGVGTAMVVLASLSIWGTINGRGPLAEMGPLKSVISLQVFLLFAAAPSWFWQLLLKSESKPRRLGSSTLRLSNPLKMRSSLKISKEP